MEVSEEKALPVSIRKYASQDIDAILRIFDDAVRSCLGDYDERQINAWLSGADAGKWDKRLSESLSVVALLDGEIVGFGNVEGNGHLDLLYVSPRHHRRKIATIICDYLENTNERIFAESSITALPFFLSRGYRVIERQTVYRKGVAIDNFKIEKRVGENRLRF